MSPQEVKIIPVRLEDKEKLLAIGYKTFYDSFGPPINTEENIQKYLKKKFTLEQITSELQNINSEFYFASMANQIVGYIKLNLSEAQTEVVHNNALEIERIYVLKEYQGNQIGQVLFKKALEVAQKNTANFMWLGVWDQNSRAIKFYERIGFKIFDKHQFLLGTDLQTDLMMKLEL
ncbi:GNAT family N-acetyltransferase [Aquimarina sp. D1M17]|uniref:GNAT family N-acetyltransferase n=1 Tax=Aquimarina acroporae TaxID=2937283 RepID=UPI0020C0C235|nr:GNAT family N-acetyltransferase [Aquimarina acroporae]MCK8520531.1 GNAT family N-acetyltransferase [Aquimarina acroporae]